MVDISSTIEMVASGAAAVDKVIKVIKGAKEFVAKPKDGAAPAQADEIGKRLQEALAEMVDVKQAQLSLLTAMVSFQAEKVEFDKEKAAFDNFTSKSADYVLTQLQPNSWVYARKADVRPGEPRPYACVPCFDKGVMSVLQINGSDMANDKLQCPECKTLVRSPNDRLSGVVVRSRR